MSSDAQSPKVQPAPRSANAVGDPGEPAAKRLVGGDATREQIKLLDLAAVELDVSRAQFIVDSAVERARQVLEDRGISLPQVA